MASLSLVDPIVATMVILLLAILAFASNRLPLGLIALSVSIALYLTGVLPLTEALAGFGDPTVLFIAALFVVSEALDATGVTAWAGKMVIARTGTRRLALVIVLSLLAAGFTALITPNGAVAALLPLVVVVAARAGIATSQLLLPLAFAAHAGSMLLLTGTPVTMLVSEYAADHGGRALGFLEPAAVGIPLVIGTVAILALFGHKLLPERGGSTIPTDLTKYAVTLRQDYELQAKEALLVNATTGITEVVIPPRSALIGTRLGIGMATPSGDLVVLAAKRGDEHIREADFDLQAGDIVLLQGTWDDLETHTAGADVLVVDGPRTLRRAVPLGKGAGKAIGILVFMVVLLATGVVPPAIAALIAALLLVLTRTVNPAQAYHAINWTTIVLIAGMIPLSTAVLSTGAADLMAGWLLDLVGDTSPYIALLALVLLTVALGQFISNTATVLILAPVAVAVASALELSVMPFLVALAVAGAASFLTPIATPANLMVMAPGGYRFGDYWKLGLPLAVLFILVAVLLVPVIWTF
jgi:di/tricarboxylate transporter